VHPLLFAYGPFHLYGYGAMLVLGGVLSLGWLRTRTKQAGLKSDDDFWVLVNAILLGGFVGGRAFYLFVYVRPFSPEFWRSLFSASNGFSVLGAFAGVPLCVWAACRWRRIPPGRVFDHLAVVAPFWHVLGRFGCFMAGCCHGRPTDVPWAVIFRDPRSQVRPDWLGVPLHPSQLYEAFGNAVIALALCRLLNRTADRRAGLVSAAYLAAYGIERFFLEFYRGDTVPLGFAGLTAGQGAGLALVAAGGVVLAWRARCSRPS
jgi:phosphatidylglycerol:prolipoprotein diacylglycerol transferase